MTDTEPTAQGAVDAGRVAFRLVSETPVLKAPDPSAPVLSVLPAGSLITITEDAGDYLYVITPHDEFGYIADETPVSPMVRTPDVDRPAREVDSAGAVASARAAYDQVWSPAAPVAAAVPKSRIDDPTWSPARPLEPSERVLIWDRVAANKRSTLFLVLGFVLFAAAFFAAVGVVLSSFGGVSAADEPKLVVQVATAAAIIALGVSILMYYAASATVLMISGAHEVTKEQEPELHRVVENLSIGSGLPMPKVWVIEDSAPNAMATGRSPGNAHVAATRGLLDKLEKRELEAVMAHEMSHVGNYDIRLMTTVAVVVGLVALVADLLLRLTWYGAGARTSNRGKGEGGIGAIILIVAIIFIVVSPIVATIMRLALSRQREYLADASGALLCRNPDALADALEKISADPEPLEVANKATAHLYITNPLKGHESFLNNLFSTHPPVQERVRLLRAMA